VKVSSLYSSLLRESEHFIGLATDWRIQGDTLSYRHNCLTLFFPTTYITNIYFTTMMDFVVVVRTMAVVCLFPKALLPMYAPFTA